MEVSGIDSGAAIDWRIPPDHDDQVSVPAKVKAALSLLIAIVALVAGQLLMVQVTAFRTYDAALVIAAAILPAELVLAWIYFADHPAALASLMTRATKGPALARLDRAAGVALIALHMPAAVVLFANQQLDRSPGLRHSQAIGRRWDHEGRHGSRSCMVSVTVDVRRPFRFGTFYGDAEAIRLPCSTWERVIPGRSRLALTIRPGLLGFAWYADPLLAE